MLIGADDVDVCIKDPGFEVAATITADLSTYVRVYLGHVPLATALRSRDIRFEGPKEIVRELPHWLLLDGSIRNGLGIYNPPAQRVKAARPVRLASS